MLIDCDIHVGYGTVLDLAATSTRRRASSSSTPARTGSACRATPGTTRPAGCARTPTTARRRRVGAQLVGQTLDRVRASVLDPLDVTARDPHARRGGGVLRSCPTRSSPPSSRVRYNDWLLERWLEPEPRLRGLIVDLRRSIPRRPRRRSAASAAATSSSASSCPGARAIPYGNPVHDPIWRACDDLALPVVVHTHFEGVGIAGPGHGRRLSRLLRRVPRALRLGMYGHFASILCHGIFERFPRTRVMMMEGGLVPFVGLLWRLDTDWRACRSEMPWCVRPPSEYVLESRPVHHASRSRSRPTTVAARAGARGPAAVGHAVLLERLPALGLRRARARRSTAPRRVARGRGLAQRRGVLRPAGPAVVA